MNTTNEEEGDESGRGQRDARTMLGQLVLYSRRDICHSSEIIVSKTSQDRHLSIGVG